MNKKLFPILSAFLLLFSLIEKGQATETYRPETSVAGFIQLPGSGRQVYNLTFMARNPSTLTTVRGRLFPLLIR